MRSLSANQRELNLAEYNAYKYSSKLFYDNISSKSPNFTAKNKEREIIKYKKDNTKYSEICKSKENLSKGNININININNINNNFGNYNNINNQNNNNQFPNNQLSCRNIVNNYNKSPDKFIYSNKYLEKYKNSNSLRNLINSNPNNRKINDNSSNKTNNSNFIVNNIINNKILENNSNSIFNNVTNNNSTNFSNSLANTNFATKNLVNTNSSNNIFCNQTSTINNSILQKKYNQEEIRYKLKKLFEYYCQFGERFNTSCLKSNKFIKFALEADFLDEEINKTRLELIFSSENKTKSKAQIDFDCFLNCLIKVAEIKYSNDFKGANKCLQALLDNHILPLYEKLLNNPKNELNQSSSKGNIQTNFNNVSNFCLNANNINFSNLNNSNNNIFNQSNSLNSKNFMRKGSDILIDEIKNKNYLDPIDTVFSSPIPFSISVKNLNSKNKSLLNKIDDIQEVINSHNNSALGTDNSIIENNMNNENNDNNDNYFENKIEISNNNNFIENLNNNNLNFNWNYNINSNLTTTNFNNLNNLSLSNIKINPLKKNSNFEYNFQNSQLEEILINSSIMLFEIYRVYFPWELSLTNDENFMRENSQKNYFLFLKEFDLCPNIISKSSAYTIWKEQVEDKLEKITYSNSAQSNNKGNYGNTSILHAEKINENLIYSNILKNIENHFYANVLSKKNAYSKEKRNTGKYFSFLKLLKCLCLIAENGIEKYYIFENEMENLENIQNNDCETISLSGNLNNLLNSQRSIKDSNDKPVSLNKNSVKSLKNSITNDNNNKQGIYKYEYALSEKVFLLLEKMEFSSGFLNIQQKTSKTNSYKSSFIISRDLSDNIRNEIENKVNEIKKQNNTDLEKRDDYENIQRQKKLRLGIKNNFKNIFEHGNYIVDRYGGKLNDLFKNYCCFGDPLNTTWMKSNKFSKLLKDANLLILNNSNINQNTPKDNNKSNEKNNKIQYVKSKDKEKEQKGILVNDIDVIFIKLSSSNSSKNTGNLNSSIFGSNCPKDLSMNTYISLGTNANRNSLNITRSSFSSSLSPYKIQNYKKNGFISNTNSAKIDFNGFVNAIEIISLNIFPEKNEFEAIDIIVTKHLFPLLKNFNHKNKYSDKYSILFQEKSNNFEYNDLISAFNKAITPIFKYYANSSNTFDFDSFIRFCSDFGIFPDIISKSKLSNIFKASSSNDFAYSVSNENNCIDQYLFVDACCLISLENPTKDSENISNIAKFITLIEKISISGGLSKISKDLKYIRISNIGESYSIIDTVKNYARHLFPKKEKPKKLNFFDILQNE